MALTHFPKTFKFAKMETHVSEFQRTLKAKTRTELVQEITMLELEVLHLEKRLLSLYENAFDRRIASSSCRDSKEINQVSDCGRMSQDEQVTDMVPAQEHFEEQQEEMLGSSIHRCHSSLDHHSSFAITQSSPLAGKVADAVYSYQSLPLTLLQHATGEASDYMTANSVSEELIRCISTIYCKLAANSMTRDAFSSPAVSSTSITSFSPSTEFHFWTPQSKLNSSLDFNSDVSLNGGFQEFSRTCSEIVEVLHLCRGTAKMRVIQPLLQKFRSLVSKLEDLNLSKLKHEEKLAFWINLHNALVMHAYLVYGIPQIKLKRASLLLKAAYNVGGQTVSLGTMQNYVLGTRLPHLGQWFLRLFDRYKKFRNRDDSESFATDRPEPLSYFALSCGSHSDPPVRVYTARRVYQELIDAREDYMMCNYRVNKDQNKVLLPKIVDTYVKESGLHPADFRGLLDQILPVDHQRNTIFYSRSRSHWHKGGSKCIGWIPHDFSFCFRFHKEVLQ